MTKSSCTIDGCERPIHNKTNGWCQAHYNRFWETGDVQAGVPIAPKRAAPRPVVDHPDGTRECQACGERKSLSDFHNDVKSPLGKRKACKVCRTAVETTRHHANAEAISIRVKAYRAGNAELVRQRDMDRYERDREQRIARATAQSHVRRARIAGRDYDRGVTVPALLKRDGGLCHYCNVTLVFAKFKAGERPDNMGTLEHKQAISRGGSHTWANCVLACWRCNISKSGKEQAAWDALRSEVALTA